ncbi:HD-GYP domain-containing protein [Paenibacillus thermoaerophilus]|uniref:HD-GYP domain-containing protein n=1 Tax=Paenibacillus thermoaerophilus TaxID=1215385 RepID=A0ABW2V4V0_9BACL|nr:HD domain-containing phosphohydrolase [Paenibacillus thermoaerophilus]TMV12485.1 HD domain-containing protein [Paenibacillus thermoaerophilus]
MRNQVLANQKLIEGVLRALNNALEVKDPYTQGHSERVSVMSEATARSMGLSAVHCERIRLAGLFHDIGKIRIRDSILFKAGRLTEEEFAEIKRHPELSVRILERQFHPGVVEHFIKAVGNGDAHQRLR